MKTQLWRLRQKQSLTLKAKIEMSKRRIREWYEYWNGEVYVSFSGGKDSTALLDLVRKLYPDVPAVFVDTGLEFPEIKEFVKINNDVTWLKPETSYLEVIKNEGYPIISKKVAKQLRELQNPTENNKATRKLYLTGIKRDGSKTKNFKLPKKYHYLIKAPFKISEKCCDIMKKKPFKKYGKKTKRKPYIGNMASDSLQREVIYLKKGCNIFEGSVKRSTPLAFWTTKDIWSYLKKFKVPYCDIYCKGYHNTGCIFCMFGVHLEPKPNRFELMERTHPLLHKYCMNKLELNKVLNYIKVPYQEDKFQTKLVAPTQTLTPSPLRSSGNLIHVNEFRSELPLRNNSPLHPNSKSKILNCH